MARRFSRLIVVITALSTVLAGMSVALSPAEPGDSCVVAAQEPVGDDNPGTPCGAQDSEESEEETEFEIKLLAERAAVSGARSDASVSIDSGDRPGSRRPLWPTSLVRGPPTSA